MASSARIDELKKKFDENPRRYFAPLANEYRKAGDPLQAIAICREFLPQQPGHMSGHIVFGQALFDAQKFEEARTVFGTALTLDPENLIALRCLGDIARGLGDNTVARVWYQRVLDADPRNDEIAAILATLPTVDEPTRAQQEPEASEPSGAYEPSPLALETSDLGGTEPQAEQAAPVETPLPVPETSAPGEVPAPVAETARTTGTPTPAEAGAVSAPPTPVLEQIEEATPPEPLAASTSGSAVPTPPEASAAPVPKGPPGASAPPEEELLDLDEIDFRAETPAFPESTHSAEAIEVLEFEVERSGEHMLMPETGVERAPEAVEPVPEAPEPALEAAEPAAEAAVAGQPDAAAPPETPVPEESEGGGERLPTPPAGGPAVEPIATETMAELYLAQGHLEDALGVFRQLLAQRPGDLVFQSRVAELEAELAGETAAAEAPQEVPDLDASGFTMEPEPEASASSRTEPVLELEEPAFGVSTPSGAQVGSEPPLGLEPDPSADSGATVAPLAGLISDEMFEPTRAESAAAEETTAPTAEAAAEVGSESAEPSVAETEVAQEPDLMDSVVTEFEIIEAEQVVESEATFSPAVEFEIVEDEIVEESVVQDAVEPEWAAAADTPEAASTPVHGVPVERVASIREFLAALAMRGPGTGGELAGETEPPSTAAGSGADGFQVFPVAGMALGDGVSVRRGGSVDALFGDSPASASDEAAASVLAGGFGGVPEGQTAGEEARIATPADPMEGAPARRANEELSLDSVFREPERPPAPHAQGFSFDRFFANPTPALGAPATEAPAEGQPAESDDDIEQFNSWLDGLKKR